MLDSGSTSVKDLGWMAANTSFNEVNINLTGLLTTGIDYQAIA
jgi:hypothetical protein